MAGFRPGFGRGGTTHSLLVRETVDADVGGGDVADDDSVGFMISEGRRWIGGFTSKVGVAVVVTAIGGGEPTVDMAVCRGRLDWSEVNASPRDFGQYCTPRLSLPNILNATLRIWCSSLLAIICYERQKGSEAEGQEGHGERRRWERSSLV